MTLAPKLYPAGLADRNSNSAYEKLKFIEEHYEELMQAYQVIMEHLKIVNESNQVELPDDLVTYDSDNNVLKSGENTIQISADVPENIVTGDASEPVEDDLTTSLTYDDSNLFGSASFYQINIPSPTGDYESMTYNLPSQPLGYVNPYTSEHYVCAGNQVLFNISDLAMQSDLPDTSNFLTSSDLPDLSGYVETSDVANEAGKIPRYNSQGHLVLPDGTEIWREPDE